MNIYNGINKTWMTSGISSTSVGINFKCKICDTDQILHTPTGQVINLFPVCNLCLSYLKKFVLSKRIKDEDNKSK